MERWRRRLGDVRIRALESYAKTCLELGGAELPGAERAARELVDVAPLRESGHLLLMGALAGDVDHATGAFGTALPSGFLSTTGVGGLPLGGGVGYLTRRFGLTVNNLVSADVVLADGRFVTASPDSHPDLFWALRGGGGNFGVVTSFTFRCYPIGEQGVIIGGPVLYDIADTEDVFRWYRDLLPVLPDEVSAWIGVAPGSRRTAIP